MRSFIVLLSLLFACAAVPVNHAPDLEADEHPLAATSTDPQDQAGLMINIGDVTANDLGPVTKKFDERISKGDKQVVFRINSNGGSITAGMDFIQHVEDAKRLHGTDIKCVVDWRAMSMGFVFLQGLCDERLMTKRGILLAHNGSTEATGTAKEMESVLQRLQTLNAAMAEIVSSRLKISKKAYLENIDGKDWTFGYQEALRVGAIDGIVDQKNLPGVYVLDQAAQDSNLLFRLTLH